MSQEWIVHQRRTVLRQDPFLRVEYHDLELPDGRRIPEWPWVITPDFINVAALTTAGKFICFRQTKYAVDGLSLAPVGGYLEPGEDPLAAAQRELREETGYSAADWTPLGRYAVDGNRGAGNAHFFLARNAEFVGHVDSDDLEEMALVLLSRAEVVQGLRDGAFKVLPWAAVMALALQDNDVAQAFCAGWRLRGFQIERPVPGAGEGHFGQRAAAAQGAFTGAQRLRKAVGRAQVACRQGHHRRIGGGDGKVRRHAFGIEAAHLAQIDAVALGFNGKIGDGLTDVIPGVLVGRIPIAPGQAADADHQQRGGPGPGLVALFEAVQQCGVGVGFRIAAGDQEAPRLFVA